MAVDATPYFCKGLSHAIATVGGSSIAVFFSIRVNLYDRSTGDIPLLCPGALSACQVCPQLQSSPRDDSVQVPDQSRYLLKDFFFPSLLFSSYLKCIFFGKQVVIFRLNRR